MSKLSSSNWTQALRTYILLLVVIVAAVGAVSLASVFLQRNESEETAHRGNQYHQATKLQCAEALEEARLLLGDLGLTLAPEGARVALQANQGDRYNPNTSVSIISTKVSDILRLQQEFDDGRFTRLAQRLADQFALVQTHVANRSDARDARSIEAAIGDTMQMVVTFKQLSRLHAIAHRELEAERQASAGTQVLTLTLFIATMAVIGILATWKVLSLINAIIERQGQTERSLRHLTQAVEQSPVTVMITDIQGRIEYVNPKFVEVTGYSSEEAIGQKPSLLKSDQTPPQYYADMWQTLGEGQPWSGEFLNRRKDSSLFWESVLIAPLRNPNGTVTHYLAVKEDVTDRKKAADELKRSNADLEQFAYAASHDMQEPLRMVTSYLQLLERDYGDGLDSQAREFIGFAIGGAKRMNLLIKDLLEYSRVATRGRDLIPVDSSEPFIMALENLKITIEEAGGPVTHDTLPTVSADPIQLTRLFQNLIGNAIKYRSKDRPLWVHVGVQYDNGNWRFSIRDNGIGIESEFLDKIFLVFRRLHGRGEYEGTGIGLAVCKKIVERHGGKIWAESEPGMGTTVHFTLAAAQAANDELPASGEKQVNGH